MPTLSGYRRRGYTPESIRNFCNSLGVSKTNGIIELRLLEHHVREDLNKRAPRKMAVLHPLRVVIDNYPEDQVEEVEAVNNAKYGTAVFHYDAKHRWIPEGQPIFNLNPSEAVGRYDRSLELVAATDE